MTNEVLQELPVDVVVHARIVVTRKSGEAIVKQLETGEPTDALRELLRDEGSVPPRQ
jgi:hypothetical protein